MFLRSAGSMVMAANIRYQTCDQNPLESYGGGNFPPWTSTLQV